MSEEKDVRAWVRDEIHQVKPVSKEWNEQKVFVFGMLTSIFLLLCLIWSIMLYCYYKPDAPTQMMQCTAVCKPNGLSKWTEGHRTLAGVFVPPTCECKP
jgi:quinol-cytochrome oxidoreductase complex cytochrome b subunit